MNFSSRQAHIYLLHPCDISTLIMIGVASFFSSCSSLHISHFSSRFSSKTVFVHCIILECLYSVYSSGSFCLLYEKQWCSIIYLSLPLYSPFLSIDHAHTYIRTYFHVKEKQTQIRPENEKGYSTYTHARARTLCMLLDIS